MAASSNFMSMDDVMEELQVDKAELDQMVDDGKLSPIRDAGKIKFRQKEVEEIKRATETEATVMFDEGELPDQDEESFDDGIFLVEDGKSESSAEEATIIGIPGADQSDSSLFGDDEETGKVEVAMTASGDEDSDQTSIIPPVDEAEEPDSEEEESIFDFGEEDISLEDTPGQSDSDIIAAEPDSSDILEAPDSSDVIQAASEDSSSDILSVSLGDDDSDSAISLESTADDEESSDDTGAVADILELDEESDDALASVEVDATKADESTASEEVVGDLLDTIDESPADLIAADEEGLETADTIDLTAADDDATATVEEVLDIDGEATEPGVLTAAEDTEPGLDMTEAAEIEMEMSSGGPMMTGDYVVPDEFVYGPAPSHPVMTTVLVFSAAAMILSGAFLVNSVLGLDSPITEWATNLALQYLPK